MSEGGGRLLDTGEVGAPFGQRGGILELLHSARVHGAFDSTVAAPN